MNDIRTQLPKCPLEYQVTHIPSSHTALVIEIDSAQIDWQERMLPWTLASLINNTDIVMKGVHLYVHCEEGVRERIADATAKIEIQNAPGVKDNKLIIKDNEKPLMTLGEHGHAYDSICLYDINYWAFRGPNNAEKLPLGHVLRHNWGWGAADYNLHPLNTVEIKSDLWLPIPEPTTIQNANSEQGKQAAAKHILHTGHLARWLHDANTAVYGENYQKKGKNIATYFFNETEPNWHLDASLLQYPSTEANDPIFIDWATRWKHLGKEAVIALYLLKTKQHAYNLRDSIMIEAPRFEFRPTEYPQLCNMRYSAPAAFRNATKTLMGAHANIAL